MIDVLCIVLMLISGMDVVCSYLAMSSVSHLILTLAEDWSKRTAAEALPYKTLSTKLDTAGHVEAGCRIHCS